MSNRNGGGLTDEEKYGVWETRTEDEGIIGSAVHSLALFGTVRPPDSDLFREEREVKEWPTPHGFWERFSL